MELAVKFCEHQLWEGVGQKSALPYLKKRGLSEESIRKFRLGYAPEGWRHMYDFLLKKGFNQAELELAGLAIRKAEGAGQAQGAYDRFRDRIMFPITDILSRPIGFSARVAPGGDESQAKYINTPETPLYHKSRALYGLSWAKQSMKNKGYTVVVEGNVDVIALSQIGIENTVAVSGTALTSEQFDIMKRYGKEVHLFFDMDGAGQKAARKSTELALEKEMHVRLIALTEGKDAADMGAEDPAGLQKVVEAHLSAPEYFLGKSLESLPVDTAEGKRAVVDDFMSLLMAIKNPLERSFWVKTLARETGLEERLVNGAVNQSFLEKTRRDGPVAPVQPQAAPNKFQTRADRVAEEVIAIFLTDKKLRQEMLVTLSDTVRNFLAEHPLFFFVLQAGEHDPLSLIENTEQKSLATRLTFRLLGGPEFANLSPEETEQKSRALLEEYVTVLENEVGTTKRAQNIELALGQAKRDGNKEEEQRLLQELATLFQK
jgi:DNA primase